MIDFEQRTREGRQAVQELITLVEQGRILSLAEKFYLKELLEKSERLAKHAWEGQQAGRYYDCRDIPFYQWAWPLIEKLLGK